MIAIDEFAARLADHATRPGSGVGVHAPADAVGGFVNATREASILQGKSCVESGDSRTDDNDLRHASSPVDSIRW